MITVDLREKQIELLEGDGGEGISFSLEALPRRFIDWQIETRFELFEKLKSKEPVRFLASHLPVLATLCPDSTVNLANKGVGLIPKAEHLASYTELLKEARSKVQGRPWEETLPERIEAASQLLKHPEHIDPYRMGTLEIFEGQTLRNIEQDPRVALLFTGSGPEYLSFQLDCVAEILDPGHPTYEFLRASRLLFEFDEFHISQPGYPFAYQFWVYGVRDKTPKPRHRP